MTFRHVTIRAEGGRLLLTFAAGLGSSPAVVTGEIDRASALAISGEIENAVNQADAQQQPADAACAAAIAASATLPLPGLQSSSPQ